MKALLWKDFRVNLPIIIAAVFIWIVAHAIAGVSMMAYVASHERLDSRSWTEMLMGVSAATLVFSQVLIGALGANAMASERGDRSAEFLFYLPMTRKQMLTSKLVVALIVAVAIWLWHLFVLEIVCRALSNALPKGAHPPVCRSACVGGVVVRNGMACIVVHEKHSLFIAGQPGSVRGHWCRVLQ